MLSSSDRSSGPTPCQPSSARRAASCGRGSCCRRALQVAATPLSPSVRLSTVHHSSCACGGVDDVSWLSCALQAARHTSTSPSTPLMPCLCASATTRCARARSMGRLSTGYRDTSAACHASASSSLTSTGVAPGVSPWASHDLLTSWPSSSLAHMSACACAGTASPPLHTSSTSAPRWKRARAACSSLSGSAGHDAADAKPLPDPMLLRSAGSAPP
mmetsp:Transcript_12191/g.29695  ORF Transcript_12191/g.29695 Transcript_12191/m.29695 type:complete len:216 (-) Transcript_12191:487-1134(-)